ncbi:nitrilase-related carbon-nitrogen hydrolase [Alicyclobacillus contaminans]|uniref:nitrilase-related carbon-nitrogen hydrolase n=1 Tax=Alicyclobacillus contaminans TaxID=392016 RepID=UPI000479C3F6|nr:nitrilase-related carbon-nitrogen hydrolase [Alicyclobacillus contaminans]
MAQSLRVALGQVRPVLGDVAANVDKHVTIMNEAKQQGASLVVFPELGLTGYQLQDLTLDVACTLDSPALQPLLSASRDLALDVVFSFVEESRDHRFYIASAYVTRGSVQHVHRKVYLPTYGMFDEGRYFAAGQQFATVDTAYGTMGMLICEDAWHPSSPYLLAHSGARVLLLPSNSPARSVTDQGEFGSQKFWRQLLQVYAQLFGVYIVFVNRVGFEDGVNFFGGSGIVSPDGAWVVQAPSLEESLVCGDLHLANVRRARYTTPLLRDEKKDLVLRMLSRIVRREGGEL